ncbi:DsbA family protein [Paludibaculum fermentans]|uniref:DsbA family protein n=1 Tax=Paludibaculum fermentans TaxID=1473598 RepID=UPI003EB9D652
MKSTRIAMLLLCSAHMVWSAEQPKPAKKVAEAKAEGITREQADAILSELKTIRQLLEKQAAANPAPPGPRATKLKLSPGDKVLGRMDAPVTMVEFTDYQCGFCRAFHFNTFPQLKRDFIDTGKVRFISRDLPLDFHANALRAAQAARCAGDQNKFWEMREVMIANASKLGEDDLNGYAGQLGINVPAFQACLSSRKYESDVRSETAQATLLNIDGTPSFLIGKSTLDGVEGEIMVGALPVAAFEKRLRELER